MLSSRPAWCLRPSARRVYAETMRSTTAAIAVAVVAAAGCTLTADFDGLTSDSALVPNAEAGADAAPTVDSSTGSAEAGCTNGVAACSKYAREVLADNPVAYFRFEDRSGSSATNEVAGSPIFSVYGAGVTLGAAGISTGSSAAHLDRADSALTLFGPIVTGAKIPFAVEAWVLLDRVPPDGSLAAAMDGPPGARTGTWLLILDGTLRTQTWTTGAHLFYADSAVPLTAQQWTHVVFGYSATEGKDMLYVNSVASQSGMLSQGTRTAPAASLVWGLFVGALDEVAVYATFPSPARIATHYAAR